MSFVTPQTTLSEIILANPALIPVLSRFDINLGVGDTTVAGAGEKHPAIDTAFLLSVINTYLNDDYFPEHTLKEFQATTIVRYLRETYGHYIRFTLPNIERHFNALVAASGDDNNLAPMRRFFDTLKQSLITLKNTDEALTFNTLDTLDPTGRDASIALTEQPREMIDDLISMLVIHLRGTVDQNLCYAVVNALMSLANDFMRNSRIRNRILLAQ